VWVVVWRPRAVGLGGVEGGFKSAVYTGDTADYKVKVLSVYINLPSAGEVAIAARRTTLSSVSDVRRGPITC
jgi:acyl dehydratase